MIYPDDNFGPTLSLVLVFGISALVLWMLGRQIYLLVKMQRRAAQSRKAHSPEASLTEGLQVIAGTVRHADNEEHAVRVEITQKAFEKENSGHYSHRWVEQSRTVKVAPFYIEHSSGERVFVEPTQEVFLVDDMDGVIFYDRNRRRRDRIAELTDGEQVYADGIMNRESGHGGSGGGYREAPKVWVLRAPPRGRLELSSHPLPKRFRRWTHFHAAAVLVTLVALVGLQASLIGYHQRLFLGETAPASFERRYHYETSGSEGSTTDHWVLQSRLPWGISHAEDISRDQWNEFPSVSPKQADPISVTVLHVRQKLVQYGDRATIAWILPLIQSLCVFGLWALYMHRKRRHTAWYEGDVVDRGKGHIQKDTGLDEKL
jgi:hypothetical protein